MPGFITKEAELEYRIEQLEGLIQERTTTADALEEIAKNIMEFEITNCGAETGFHAAASIAMSLVSSAILKEVIELRR